MKDTRKTVKNIIAGYLAQEEVKDITFFIGDEVMFSGSYETFIRTTSQEIDLLMIKKKCMKAMQTR